MILFDLDAAMKINVPMITGNTWSWLYPQEGLEPLMTFISEKKNVSLIIQYE